MSSASESEGEPSSDDSSLEQAEQLPLFVYGTLRNGHENYGALRGRTVYEMPALLDGMVMYSLFTYPILIEGESTVHGELMTLHPRTYSAVLAELDHLEGYRPDDPDSRYFRVIRPVRTQSGVEHLAWVYLGNPAELARSSHLLIPHGDWNRYRREMLRNTRFGRFDVERLYKEQELKGQV